ncbi:hypothetical protein IB256_04035 [Pseudomonas sp. PDM17]|uniref:hypothetical protein n=1 Tax=Pseudomonas sp. PDM17 TaxID=2769285 RepID=UPI001785D678|nr:hypothetical protein [Pseudomonas sp. PDM17]MBD9499936.1 hypothetical protein [Pseudomonas sp. PDM17]
MSNDSGAKLVADLAALVGGNPAPKRLPAVATRGALADKRGRSDYQEPAATGTGSIASPLTEPAYEDRTFYNTAVTYKSTDGLWSFTVNPIREVKMVDGNETPVRFVYAQPPASPA